MVVKLTRARYRELLIMEILAEDMCENAGVEVEEMMEVLGIDYKLEEEDSDGNDL